MLSRPGTRTEPHPDLARLRRLSYRIISESIADSGMFEYSHRGTSARVRTDGHTADSDSDDA